MLVFVRHSLLQCDRRQSCDMVVINKTDTISYVRSSNLEIRFGKPQPLR